MTPITPRLRYKYRVPKVGKRTTYRARTGPGCCNSGCGNGHGKMWRALMGRGSK